MKITSQADRPRGDLHLALSDGDYAGPPASVLAGVLESVDDLFAAVDADLRFVAFNGAFRTEWTSVCGSAPAVGQSLHDSLQGHPEQQVLADMAHRALEGEAFSLVQEFSDQEKRRKYYQINVTPVPDADGKTVVVAIVARDITEKRDAERKFRQLLEASPDALLITCQGVIEYINVRAEEMFGYPHDALIGQTLEKLVPSASREQHFRKRTEYENAPVPRSMGSGLHLHGQRADGSEFPVEVSLNPLSVAGKTMVVAAVRDTTERRKAVERLRRENEELRATVTELSAQLKDWRQRERSAKHLSKQYRSVFEQGAAGIVVTAPDGRILQVNNWLCNMLGYRRDELLQLRIHDVTHPDDVDVDLMMDGKMLAGLISSYTLEKRFSRKDGRVVWGALSASAQRNEDGTVQHFVHVIADITRRKETEQKLTDAHFRMKMAAEIGRLGFWEHDVVSGESYFSPEWKEQAGYLDGELPSSMEEWGSRLHPDDRSRVLEILERFIKQPRGELQFEYRFRHRDGGYRWFLSRVVALVEPSGKTRKIIGIRVDITDRKNAEWAIRQEGLHDTLTGLPNRRLLHEYAAHVLAVALRGGVHGAIVFIDLDHFKEINDTYGHEAGDELLKEVARRLSGSIRKGDIAGRLGGDEFMVILPQVNDAISAAAIAEHLLARLNKPHRVGNVELAVTPSIGVAVFPDGGDDLDTLIRKADRAMYAAKEQGRSRVQVFTPEMARRAEDALALENRLKAGLTRQEFELHFQPIADATIVEVVGAEALLRWHPQPDELVAPKDFIPVAESTGIIGELGEWVLRSACRQQMQWQREGMPALRMAVNISPVQFRQKDFVARMAALVRDTGVDPAMIQLELAESTVMQDIDKAIEVIKDLHKLGVRIAIDDVGTGGGDPGSLSRLPVNTLKIDVSSVHELERGPKSQAVATASAALGHSLGLEVVAEGVESEQTLACIRAHRCELVQGFHVGRPMPPGEFQRWYQARRQ